MTEPVARTVKDFCRAYGVSRPTVYRLLAAGRLHAVKVSRTKTLILEESARAWLRSLIPTHVRLCTPVHTPASGRDNLRQEKTARTATTPQVIGKSKKVRQHEIA